MAFKLSIVQVRNLVEARPNGTATRAQEDTTMMSISGHATKKSLKSAIGERPCFVETSMFGNEFKGDGEYTIVGPSPYDRKWYATVTVRDGLISKVS